eukprot:TRINITY_DN684_c0_g1_i2.p1 TRINITY_DN684_c0_g1~~TRINITY_DN684_c0_g1_i2.p1  ORF type:complete len:417 (-),score=82.98 TRINITY_DN684_c0_g1_i2:743-1993(-)
MINTFTLFAFLIVACSCQNTTWQHLSGSKQYDSNIQIDSPSGITAEYIYDKTTNVVYLYGGFGNNGRSGYMSDVWQYNLTSNTWKHIIGPKTTDAEPDYTPGNGTPGGILNFGMVGNTTGFFIFGGNNGDLYNNVWHFSYETTLWEHVYGSQEPDTLASIPYNIPGSTGTMAMTIDGEGLIFFGGQGFDFASEKLLNNVWKYRINSAVWEHLSGSTTGNAKSNFTEVSGYPGGRRNFGMVMDTNTSFVICGGLGYSEESQIGLLNDVWRFDMVSKSWQFLSGSTTADPIANYTDGYSHPGGLKGFGMVMETETTFLIFGGEGHTTLSNVGGFLNDVWRYDLNKNLWTFISGSKDLDNQPNYNSTSGAHPGGISEISLLKLSNETYLVIGGIGYKDTPVGLLNDVWKLHGKLCVAVI